MTREGRSVGRVLALVVVALVLGMCLVAAVEASSSAHHECHALTDGQTVLSKPPPSSPGLVMIPVDPARLVVPSGAAGQPPPHPQRFTAAAPSDGPPARSPPATR